MKTKPEDNTLIIYLEGRIDTTNAPEIEKSIAEALSENVGLQPVFNAENLEYISSAGLRVLMKLRKQSESPLVICEVSPEVYDIFETTGFTELFDVKKRLRQISIEGCEQIGAGISSRVYRIDRDTIVKVFYPGVSLDRIEEERENAKTAFVSGIPTAITFDIVKVGDCYGTVYELIDAVQLSRFLRDNPDRAAEYRIKYAKMIKDMHQIKLSDRFQDLKQSYFTWFKNLTRYYTQEEVDLLCRLVDTIPDRDTFVHCDAHVGNIMVQDGELILIDMADVGRGHPIFDLGTLYYHYQTVPNSPGRDFGMQTVLGFVNETNEFTDTLWKDLINTYFKIESEQDLKMIDMLNRVAGGLRSVATVAKQSQMPEKYKQMSVQGIRQNYLPRLEEFIALYSNIDRYF